jgi:hypothetical protein
MAGAGDHPVSPVDHVRGVWGPVNRWAHMSECRFALRDEPRLDSDGRARAGMDRSVGERRYRRRTRIAEEIRAPNSLFVLTDRRRG